MQNIYDQLDEEQILVAQKVAEEARRQGLDESIALAVAFNESSFRPNAKSGVGAQGVMQLMPITAKEMGVEDVGDVDQNIRGGVGYLKKMRDRFGDPAKALAAYNAGPGNVSRYGGVPPFSETQEYVRKIPILAQSFERSPFVESAPLAVARAELESSVLSDAARAAADSLASPDGRVPLPDTPPPPGEYRLSLPDGRFVLVKEGVSEEQATRIARERFPESFAGLSSGDGDSSPIDAFWASANRSVRGVFPAIAASFAALTGDEEAYDEAQGEIADATLIASEIAPDLVSIDEISQAYEEDGLGTAIGKAFEFGFETIAGSFGFQVPSALAALGGYGLGAAAVAAGAPIAAGTVATLAGLGAMFATFLSEDVERAYENGAVDTEDLSLLRAISAAGGQTALNSLTYLLVGGGALGRTALKGGLSEGGKKVAYQSVGKALEKLDKMSPIKQAGAVLLEEEVAEVGQQALERFAAGLPVSPTDEGAADEYVQTMLATLAPGAGFGAIRYGTNTLHKNMERANERQIRDAAKASGDMARRNSEELAKIRQEDLQTVSGMVEDEIESINLAAGVTAEEIHRAANTRNILYDNDPGFMVWMSNLRMPEGGTLGKYEIDRLNEQERAVVLRALEGLQKQDPRSSFYGPTLRNVVDAFSEYEAQENKGTIRKDLQDILFKNRGIKAERNVKKAVIDRYLDKMERAGLVVKKGSSYRPRVEMTSALEEQYEKIRPLIRKNYFPSKEEILERSGINDSYVTEELLIASIARGDFRPPATSPREQRSQYRITVDGYEDVEAFPTYQEAAEESEGITQDEAKPFEEFRFEERLRIPEQMRTDPVTREISIAEEEVPSQILGSRTYKIPDKEATVYEIIDERGRRVAIRSSKGLANNFVEGSGDTRVDIFVDGQRIGSARNEKFAKAFYDKWARGTADQNYEREYQGVYDENYADAEAYQREARRIYDEKYAELYDKKFAEINYGKTYSDLQAEAVREYRPGTAPPRTLDDSKFISQAEAYTKKRMPKFKRDFDEEYIAAEAKSATDKSMRDFMRRFREQYPAENRKVESRLRVRPIKGYKVKEVSKPAEGGRAQERIVEVFATRKQAEEFVGRKDRERTATDSRAKRSRDDLDRESLEGVRSGDEDVVRQMAEKNVSQRIDDYIAAVEAGDFYSELDRQESMASDSRKKAINDIDRRYEANEIDADQRLAAMREAEEAYESKTKEINSRRKDISQEMERMERKKQLEDSTPRLIDDELSEGDPQRAEWVSDLENVAKDVLRRLGVPVQLRLYAKKGNEETGAEYLTESMLIRIGYDLDLESVVDEVAEAEYKKNPTEKNDNARRSANAYKRFQKISPFLNHELIHGSRRLGLIKASEWQVLTDYVSSEPIPQEELSRINSLRQEAGLEAFPEATTYLDYAKEVYGNQGTLFDDRQRAAADLESGNITQEQYDRIIVELDKRQWIADDYVEEAVAKAFQDFTSMERGEMAKAAASQPKEIKGVIDRVINFFRQFVDRMKKRGYPTSDDIFYTFMADNELGRRFTRGKALDTFYLRRQNSAEFQRLKEYAAHNGLPFPNLSVADPMIEAQEEAEGITESVRRNGKELDEFAVEWVNSASKTSPEIRKANNAGVPKSALNPVFAPASSDPRNLRARGVQGDLDSYTWGEFAFDRFGSPGTARRVIVTEGYTEIIPSNGKTTGMGLDLINESVDDVQRNTNYSNPADLISAALQRVNPQTIKTGEISVINDGPDRSIIVWDSPDFVRPVSLTMDYVRDPKSASGGGSGDYWNIVGLNANGKFSTPRDPNLSQDNFRGPEVSAEAVLASKRPDLSRPTPPSEERRYATDRSTADLDPISRAAVDKVMSGIPNPPISLFEKVTSALPKIDSPKFIDILRTSFLDKYNQLWRNGYALRDKGGWNWTYMLADTAAHAAALQIDRASAFYSGMLKYGTITMDKPDTAIIQGEGALNNVDGTFHVRDLDLTDSVDDAVVGLRVRKGPDGRDILEEVRDDVTASGLYSNTPTGGLISILQVIANPEKNLLPEFFAYSQSLRALRFRKENKPRATESNWSNEEIASNLRLAQQYPEIAVVHRNLQNWNSGLINVLVDSGVITPDMGVEMLASQDYTPFYTDIEQDADGNRISESLISIFKREIGEVDGKRLDGLSTGIPFEKLTKAAKREMLMEPVEAISRNAMGIITAALKNVAQQRALRDATLLGTARDVTGEGNVQGNVHSVLINGEERFFQVTDEMLHNVIAGSFQGNRPTLDGFRKAVSKPANWLREAVTRSPAFLLRNIQRDALSGWVLGTEDMGIPMLSTMKRYGSNLAHQYRGTETPEYNKLSKYGSVGGYELIGISPEKLRKTLVRKMSGDSNKLMNFWDAWGEASGRSEAATREQVYKSVRDRTKNKLMSLGYGMAEAERIADSEGAFQGLEYLNFSRRGNNPGLELFTAGIPFLNARMQGLDRLGRAFIYAETPNTDISASKKRMVIAQRGLVLSGITGMMAALLYGNEDYEDLRKEQRDDNWMLMLPSFGDGPNNPKFWSVPIPFEIGILFKVIPEQFTRTLMSAGGAGGTAGGLSEFADSMKRSIFSTLGFNPIPQAVRPIAESYFNYNMFTHRPIVPKYMENLEPVEQRKATTSPFAAGIASFFDVIDNAIGIVPEVMQSPLHVESMIRGYNGTLGTYALDVADGVTNLLYPGDYVAPTLWDDTWVLGDFLRGSEGGQKSLAYEIKNESDRVVQTINKLASDKEFDKLREYKEKNKDILASRKAHLAMAKFAKKIRERKAVIRRSKMGAVQKRNEMARLDQIEAKRMRSFNENMKSRGLL